MLMIFTHKDLISNFKVMSVLLLITFFYLYNLVWITYILIMDSSVCHSLFEDVLGPTFSNCPQNIVTTADRGNTSTSVTWTPPTATDNSGVIPDISRSGKRPGERFSAGEHNIRYIASDKTGNVAECRFKVFVSGSLT